MRPMCFSLKYQCTCSVAMLYTIESWHKGILIALFTNSTWIKRMSITKHVLERDKIHFWVDCEHFGNLELSCSIQDFIFLLSANRKVAMRAIFNHITLHSICRYSFLRPKQVFERYKTL